MSQDTFPVHWKDRATQRHDEWPWLSLFLKQSVLNLKAWSCCCGWCHFCQHHFERRLTLSSYKKHTIIMSAFFQFGVPEGTPNWKKGFYHVRNMQIMFCNLAGRSSRILLLRSCEPSHTGTGTMCVCDISQKQRKIGLLHGWKTINIVFFWGITFQCDTQWIKLHSTCASYSKIWLWKKGACTHFSTINANSLWRFNVL